MTNLELLEKALEDLAFLTGQINEQVERDSVEDFNLYDRRQIYRAVAILVNVAARAVARHIGKAGGK